MRQPPAFLIIPKSQESRSKAMSTPTAMGIIFSIPSPLPKTARYSLSRHCRGSDLLCQGAEAALPLIVEGGILERRGAR